MEKEEAEKLAIELHDGQLDKAGMPYILHPQRVAGDLQIRGFSTDHQVVALLHDVVEDCPGVTLDSLRADGVSEKQLEAIDAISRRDDEKYADYIRRCSKNPIAKQVKIADLYDNLSPARQSGLKEYKQKSLRVRYTRSLAFLEGGYDVF